MIPSVAVSDGGPSRAIVVIESALTRAGVKVVTLTTDHGLKIDAITPSVRSDEAARVYIRKWTRFYKVAPGMIPYLIRHIEEFDVVHIHALFSFSSTVAAWIARWRGVPYVVRPLGTLSVWGARNRRRALKRLSLALIEGPSLRAADAVHFTSHAELSEAEELGLSFHGVVIPLGVESDAPVKWPAQSGRKVVLYLSRLDPKKNVEALIDAFAANPRLRATAMLRIAGDGPPDYVATLKARARAAGLEPHIEWLGHVEGEQKARAFAQANLFVLPSFTENFGIAAAEAMLAGLPCLLSPGVALAHPAREAGAAIVIEPKPAPIAESILHLLERPQEMRNMGARARAFALSQFSPEAMAARLIALYREIAPKRKGKRNCALLKKSA